MALFLGGIALSTSYYFTQTQASLSSSSQVTNCQAIVKQALESTVSLGARLYGYRMNHHDQSEHLKYPSLFLTKNTKAWDVDGNIKDVNDGSEITYPPKDYTDIFKNLGLKNVPQQTFKANTGHPLIGNTYPYDISTSVFIVNSVNALQYLYNADNGFFTANSGKGKKYTTSTINSGDMSVLLNKYEDQFDLEDIEFFIKISPIDLQTNQEMASPPSQILTRPRFHNPSAATPSPALNVLGNENIGFEIKALLKYERENQEYECEGSHRFTHQIKPITKTPKSFDTKLTGLTNGAGKDFLADTTLENTSCDTDGAGYDDINVTVDFNDIEHSQQAGTVLLCRMNSYCVSYGNGSYGSCSPEEGRWQRCNDIQPNPSPTDQVWTFKAKLKAEQELTMTFEGMKPNRRYELDIGEFSIAAHNLRLKTTAKFFLDATRPSMGNVWITNDAVGSPTDDREDREYEGPRTNWIRPPNSTGDWIQCNTNTVEFAGDIVDQFIHNLVTCVFTGSRQDGNGTSTTSPTSNADCSGELSGIQHGRQTITFQPSDSCSHRVTPPALGTPKDLVWDTDLPSTFSTQNFSTNPFWFRNTSRNAYSIQTVVPGTGAGRFPKHYSVDCDENFLNLSTRNDGNSGTLTCSLQSANTDHDDGCNPIDISVKYYHVCGNNENCESSNWAVYAPQSESCQNVRCEPGLICCDGYNNECGSVSTNECETDSYPHSCTDPKGGGRSQQDSASGCPPLGLYNCSYSLPCEATSPGSLTGPSSYCVGKRQGNSCSFPVTGTCSPNAGTSWQSSPPSTAGTCSFSGTSYTESCTAGSASRCVQPCTHTCYDACHPSGHSQTVCDKNNKNCNVITVPCTHLTCNPHDCHGCHDYEYRATTTTCPRTFSGNCGTPSGSCSPLGVGGGNVSLEQCDRRPATCNLCNSATTCCPGDTYPTNSNCPCNSATHCCSGDTYPSNQNCTCNSATTCCPGNTFPANPNCDPNNNNCDPATTCCAGNSYPANANCPCDSNTHCCQGDSHPSNPNCQAGCDNTITCCAGDSFPANQNCKANGECSKNGCKKGTKKPNSNGRLWRCEGANGGTTTGWCPLDGVCGPPGKCKKGRPVTKSNGNWICEGISGGTDTGNCDKICDSSKDCCKGDTYPSNPNCKAVCACNMGSCRGNGCQTDYSVNSYTQNTSQQVTSQIFTCKDVSNNVVARCRYYQKVCTFSTSNCPGPSASCAVFEAQSDGSIYNSKSFCSETNQHYDLDGTSHTGYVECSL